MARKLQSVDGEPDDRLTALAQLGRPTVRHWWGRRQRPGWNGAVCYLCGSDIATWPSRWPITDEAKLAIDRHRTIEIAAHLGERRHTREETR